MSFGKGLSAYAARTKLSIDDAVIAINSKAADLIISRTPRDTGRAKGNWIPTISIPSSDITDNTDEAMAKSQSNLVASQSAGKVFYIANNLPYIVPLEYGWSKQAPGGMVRLTIQEIKSFIIKEWRAV
ncbi:MAG: HK97 gp10 family phage protein [Gammaproteobacteria bacterium]|nr:HK97 gp10 family phage protein [Gammaproteobacteria bacterium]